MEARIIQFPNKLREIPTQEIRSIYQGLADASYIIDEVVLEQNMERVMIEMHEQMNPDIEFDHRLWWLAILVFDGIIAFLIGFGLGKL